MAEFLSDLKIRCHPTNENYWELEAPLIYRSDMVGLITVPEGFCCDLASTRHIPFVSFIWGNRAHREAVIHDYLYRTDSKPVVGFGLANSIFLEAMESRGKEFLIRWPMYLGVILGGYWSYHKNKVDWKPDGTTPVCEPGVQHPPVTP